MRDDITQSDPLVTGAVGSSPEIHEKIFWQTGRGVVVLFAAVKGNFRYVTAHKPARSVWSVGEVVVSYDGKGRAVLEADFTSPGAAIVFFGINEPEREQLT